MGSGHVKARWTNGLGEVNESNVRAMFQEFTNDGLKSWLVVYDWRCCGFIVVDGDECELFE